MAYGNTDTSLLRKAIPIGYEDLTVTKHADLLYLREYHSKAFNFMMAAIWPDDPLRPLSAKEREQTLVAAQKAFVGLNKTYVEKARLAVAAAFAEAVEYYYGLLIGKAMHCASLKPEVQPGKYARKKKVPEVKQLWSNVSTEVQDQVTQAELDVLEAKCKHMGSSKLLGLFRRLLLDNDASGLTGTEALVLKDIHKNCLGRSHKPVHGRKDTYVCQIQLDYRVLKGVDTGLGSKAADRINDCAHFLVDSGNKHFQTFLEISNPRPHGELLRLPIDLNRKLLDKLERDVNVNALLVEISSKRMTVRAILAKKKPEPAPLPGVLYIMARDWGLKNTSALSVVRVDEDADLSEERLQQLCAMTKEEVRTYYQTHSHDDANVVERMRFNGDHFMRLVAKHCEHIDRLRSEVDCSYDKLEAIKLNLQHHLKLGEADLIPEHAGSKDQLATRLVKKFFNLLGHVQHLKSLRRKTYAKIAALKKNWFGYCTNQEVALALKYKALVCCEQLTVEAIPVDDPKYRGRTFNKLMNNGCKGQFARMAGAKHEWVGNRLMAEPAFHSSSTCYQHALVDKTMRNGEVFFCPKCGRKEHSDEHAADTLAQFFLLRPSGKAVGSLQASKCLRPIGAP